MTRYMILALICRRSMITAFFDEWSDAQNYLENIRGCADLYIEVYERRPHGKGKDYAWEYTRIHRFDFGGMEK